MIIIIRTYTGALWIHILGIHPGKKRVSCFCLGALAALSIPAFFHIWAVGAGDIVDLHWPKCSDRVGAPGHLAGVPQGFPLHQPIISTQSIDGHWISGPVADHQQ